jgi:hypothetical protein
MKTQNLKIIITFLIILLLASCQGGPTPTEPPAEPTEVAIEAKATPTEEAKEVPTDTPAPTPTPEILFPPLVVQTTPERGEEQGLDEPIEIAFDQPMNRQTVEKAFAVEPAVAGDFIWVSDTTLRFTPADEYERGQRYKVTIEASAESADGLPLNRSMELAFSTVGYLEVTEIQPAEGSVEVAPDTTITVLFNRPVVPLTAIENLTGLPQPLTFVPPVTGQGEWLNTSIYQFTPDEGFEPATKYTARVAAGLTAVDGSILEDDFTWKFTTATPKVVATYPDDGRIYVSPTPVISVAFNQLMDRESVEAAFNLENAMTGETVEGTFVWVEKGLVQPRDPYEDRYYYDYLYDSGDGPPIVGVETVAFTPDEPLDLGITYTASIAPTAKGRQGNQSNLEQRYKFDFITIPDLEIVKTYPNDGATGVAPYQSLEVTFSGPVNPQSIKVGENVLISPSVAVTRVYTYFWDSNTELNLNFPIDASSAYTVTLLGSIESRYGQSLGEDTTIHWQTGAYDPMVFLHSPGRVGSYSTYTPTMVYVSVRNVGAVNFSLYSLPERDFIRLNGANRWSNWRKYTPDEDDLIRTWQIETAPYLNQNLIYGSNLAGEEGGILEPGLYYLEVEIDSDKVYPEARKLGDIGRSRQMLVVSEYNMTAKSSSNETMAWLTDLRTTEPFAGANTRFLDEEGRTLASGVTDDKGVALGQHERLESWRTRFVISDDPFAIAATDWSEGVERWNYGLSVEDYLQPYNAIFYTDRAIYRPGQTVYFKGIIRRDDDARYTLPPRGDTVNITVMDSQGKEILAKKYFLNENGSLHGEIELDEEAALGYYYIEARYNDEYFGKDFQVAEYRKPEFIVEVTTDKPEYVNGDTILLTAQANYFFGGPVPNAPVRYNILSEDFFFRYDGPGGWYDFTDFDYSRTRGEDYYYGFGELIEEGTGTTDAKGKFSLEVSADISERLASQRFTLEVVVTDSDSNQEVSSRAEAVVHKGNYYIGLRPERYVGQTGKENQVNVLTVDWDSQPVGDKDLTVVFYQHKWYSVRVKGEDGRYYWDSTVEDIPVYTTTITTDDKGQAVTAFTPENGGVHKVEAQGLDDAGNVIRSSTYMWISGRKYINWRQENNDRIDLVTDKKEYNVGDVATILIPHPYSGTVTALVTQERGHIYDYDVMTLETNSEQLEIPITKDMLPNMFVSVVVMKGPDENEPIPSFKVGYAQLPINVKEKEIIITLTPDKPAGEVYQPSDEVTFAVQATDYEGNPVEAEFSLALVDKAILSLAEDTSGSLLERFWRERGLGVGTATGLAISAERVNLAIAPEAKGGGGGFEEAFGIIRGEFKDTAFWVADFTTDEEGQGTVTASLPDNLTTWVLTARGITKDTLVGDDSIEIVSTKPLLVRPVTPRFFVVGDEAQLKMVVQNNTREDLTVTTLFEGLGVKLMDAEAGAEVSIEAGGKATLVYPVKVSTEDEAVLRFGAKGRGYEDAVEIKLPIHRHSTPETVGTSGVLAEDGVRLEGIGLPASYDPTQGGLKVKIEPSLAAGMRAGLDYLEHFPYECTEQTVSRFLPNVVTYRAYQQLDLDNPELAERLPALVSTGLQRLYAQQRMDGGWGWWTRDKSQPFLTAYVLLGMIEAQKADFAVEQSVIDDGIHFLKNSLRKPQDVTLSWQANQQAFILYVLAEGGDGDLGRTVSLFDQREKLDLFGRAYLAMAFGLLEPDDDTRVKTLLSDITGQAVVSATGTHWEEAWPDYYSMNTDTRSTAIIIAALSRLDPENALAPNAVRWLMSVRQRDYWETTQETAWAIIALTDWMVATGELQGKYAWNVSLNGETLGDGEVSPATIDQTETLVVAVKDLLTDEINRLIVERSPQAGDPEGAGRLYYTAHLEYYKPVEEVKALERGIIVARQYTLADDEDEQAISEAKVGDIINVKITLIAPHDLHYVVVEDPIPAGTEGIDRSLNITSVVGERPELVRTDGPGWGWWWFSHTELRDEKAALFATYLPRGTYEYNYQIRASLAGEYRVIPTHAEEMYFPEVFGRGDGGVFTITE